MPNKKKNEEEPKYEPFSKEEKAQIIARHRQIVDDLNKHLPEGQKLAYNENLEKELDNPENIALYRIGQRIHEKQLKQKTILTNLEGKYGKRTESNSMSRSLQYVFDTSGTKEAQEYNERIYRDYMQDPDKVAYQRCKKFLDYDPTEAFNTHDDKIKLAEYYEKTYPLCEEAFVFHSVVKNGNPTPAMEEAVVSMKKPLEVLSYPANLVKSSYDIDSFAFPNINRDQVEYYFNHAHEDIMKNSEIVNAKLNGVIEEAEMDKPSQYYEKLQEHNIPIESGTFLKNKPVEQIENNGQVTFEEISYDKLMGQNNGQFSVKQRSEDETFQVRCMNKSFVKRYTGWWDKQFQETRGEIGDFNIEQIENKHKGGFFERYIWHSTSNEYKEMIQAMKDFHNPNSKHFGDKAHLRGKAKGYIDHKMIGQGYATLDQMKGTSKIRTQLALDIIETCDEKVDFEGIENEWYKENEVHLEENKEQFLKAKDVEEKPLVKEEAKEKQSEVQKEKENEIQNENVIKN